MRPREVMTVFVSIVSALFAVGLTNVDAASALESARLSTAEAAEQYQRLSKNVTDSYFSNEEISLFLYGLADAYSDIVSVFSIGRQLCLAYALDLITSTAPLAQDLRERSHTIIIPTLNPDGYELNTRENKDGVDLNRALPDRSEPDSGPTLAIKGSEAPEVLAVAGLATMLPLTGAASLHEGAMVAIIPWDGDAGRQPGYAAAPDDETFKFLAETYAEAHTRMAEQTPRAGSPPNKEYFAGGVSNGNDWYPVYNGLQDWLYVATGCRAITLELSETKAPAASLLPSIWEENRDAMPALAAAATLAGLRLSLTGPGAAYATARAGSGLPAFAHTAPASALRRGLTAATGRGLSNAAHLRGGGDMGIGGVISEDDTDVAAREDGTGIDGGVEGDSGVIHLPLAPGTYNISVEAPGAEPMVRVVDIPADGSGARLPVELTAPPQVAAAHGQQVEHRPRHSAAIGGGFPFTILRGRRADAVLHEDQAQLLTPDMQIGAGVHSALVGGQQVNVATGDVTGGQQQVFDADAVDAHAGAHAFGPSSNGVLQPGGDTAGFAGLNEDQADGIVQHGVDETLGGGGVGGHARVGDDGVGADAQGAERSAGGVDSGMVDSGIGGGVAAVMPDKPHSTLWRSVRGLIAAAGAAFVVVQLMRLKGRPVIGGLGWPDSGGRGPRGGRRGGQAVAHGHHSFHQRPGIV